jgi:hypothetical protein
MKTYKVQITETLQRVVEVPAKNRKEAYQKVEEIHSNEEIVLDAGDYVKCNIRVL